MSEDYRHPIWLKSLYYAGAALSFIISFIVFFKTMAPTVSFWDCGEFIASAKILGVPHPPGTPLFVLIARFFIILGIFSSTALNTNFISVLSSALTAAAAYFIIVKVSGFILSRDKDDSTSPVISYIGVYIGALSASLIMAFSSTFWFNAVESEVYGLSMFMMAVITYLAIKWAEAKPKGGGDIMLVGIAYLLFLSIGIHLTVFLITPALILFFALVDRKLARDWRFWVSWGIFISFAVPLYFPIQALIPVLMDYQIETWIFLMLGFTAICGYKAYVTRGRSRLNWSLYLGIMLAGIIGFSSHLYIPIRAAQKPRINEKNPDNWSR